MRFQSEISVFKFLWRSVDGALKELSQGILATYKVIFKLKETWKQ